MKCYGTNKIYIAYSFENLCYRLFFWKLMLENVCDLVYKMTRKILHGAIKWGKPNSFPFVPAIIQPAFRIICWFGMSQWLMFVGSVMIGFSDIKKYIFSKKHRLIKRPRAKRAFGKSLWSKIKNSRGLGLKGTKRKGCGPFFRIFFLVN